MFLWTCLNKNDELRQVPGAYLIHSTEIFEEGLGSTKQSLIFWADDNISHVSLGAKRIQEKLLPVRQTKGRQHHKVVLIPDQKSRDGQRLRRLVCTCDEKKAEARLNLPRQQVKKTPQCSIPKLKLQIKVQAFFHAPYDPLPAILWNCCQVSGPCTPQERTLLFF